MKTIKDAQVGDKVIMVNRTGIMRNGTGEVVPAIVTSAKPVNLTICETTTGIHEGRVWKVRRDTGQLGVRRSTYGWRAWSAEEYVANQRTDRAHKFLRKQGILLDLVSPWKGREIELADLLANAGDGA